MSEHEATAGTAVPRLVPIIRKVGIKRFKRFEDEEFTLKPFTLLIGPNNHGKSTLLQAFSAWQYAYQIWRSARKTVQPGPIAKNQRGVPIALPNFHCVPLTDFKHLWFGKRTQWFDQGAYAERRDKNGVKEEGPKYQGAYDVEVHVEWESIGPRASPDDPPAHITRSFGMRFHYENEQSISVKPTVETRELPPDTQDIVLTHIPPFSGLDATEGHMADGAIRVRIGLSQPGSVVRNLLWRVYNEPDKRRWQDLKAAVRRFVGVELLDPQFRQDIDPHITCQYVDRLSQSDEAFDLVNGGSGFHQLLTIFSILFWNKGTHLLLDEPDAHLHAWAQAGILDYLRDQARRREAQIVIATHSLAMLDRSEAEDVYSLMTEKPVWLVSDKEKFSVRSGLDAVETSLLTYLQRTPFVLYLEGTSDADLLRLWARALGRNGDLFERLPIHYLGSRNPKHAREHFLGLKSFRSDLAGLCILDPDRDPERVAEQIEHLPEAGLRFHVWQRRHIESYLLVPQAIGRAVHGDADLLAAALIRAFRDFLSRPPRGLIFPAAVPDYRTFHMDWMADFDAKRQVFSPAPQDDSFVAEQRLEELTPDHVAQAMLPEEIHEDVAMVLQHIFDAATEGT